MNDRRGETDDELPNVMHDLRRPGVEMPTVGQHLQQGTGNLPVERCVAPAQFGALARQAHAMGFSRACSPPVHSSYHADQRARATGV